MTVFEGIIAFLLFAYLVMGLYLLIGIMRKIGHPVHWEPQVSVVLTARNEQAVIRDCLTSLSELDYPREKLEIILVDDGSTDETGAILQDFAKNKSHVSWHVLHPDEKLKPGKACGMLHGIERSSGEIIFVTDADCRVPKSWIRELLSLFEPDVAFVGGVTLLDKPDQPASFFTRLQSIDWMFLLGTAYGLSNIDKPAAWIGNNLAYRRSVYDKVGGYRKLDYCLVEDFTLLSAICEQTAYKARFTLSPHAMQISTPAPSLIALYKQRRRWASGVSSVRPMALALMLCSFLTHLALVILSVQQTWAIAAMGIVLVFAVDALILFVTSMRVGRRDLLTYFVPFQIFYFLYTIFLPLLLLIDHNVHWKETVYSASDNKPTA